MKIEKCEKCGKPRGENNDILHIVKAKQGVGKNQLQVCDDCLKFWSVGERNTKDI